MCMYLRTILLTLIKTEDNNNNYYCTPLRVQPVFDKEYYIAYSLLPKLIYKNILFKYQICFCGFNTTASLIKNIINMIKYRYVPTYIVGI